MAKKRNLNLHENNCNTPVYQNATYFFNNTKEIIRFNNNEIDLGRYGRYTNPNWTEVEQCLAQKDNTEEALLFSSGMNAIVTSVLAFLEHGDRIIFTGNCYRNSRVFFSSVLPKMMNVTACPISSADIDHFENTFIEQYKKLRPKIVFVEMPCNPHLYLVDIEKIKDIIDDSCLLIVDSTLSSPYNFRPINFGADLVIQSCTKYISGHGDIMAGSVSGPKKLIDQIRVYRNIMGGIVDPQCAALLHRSLKTFDLRMAHYNQAGMKLARYLENSPYVDRVFYTGLDSHPHAALAEKYLSGHGGVIAFELIGDRETTARFVDTVQMPFMGSNFGTDTSLIEQCSIFTYYHYSQEELDELDISDTLIRFSLGYEDVDLIINDIEAAFTEVFSKNNL